MEENKRSITEVLGYNIYTRYPSFCSDKNTYIINTINPHSYCVAKKDKIFKEALLNSDVLLPDGSGIVFAVKILMGKKINKIAGADVHQYLIENAHLKSQKVFYLGASKSTLNLIEKRLKKEFPNIQVATYSPPYKSQFSEKDTDAMIHAVNIFKPDYLFLGMTAPKQEKWVYENHEKLKANVIASIGAVFDFYAGNINRAPKWMIELGIEWLHRSLISRRLMIRNLKSNPIFLYDLIIEKMKNITFKR
jgi:N-acetylglucosaminyldiphosphoundecaprenol N-acetyl-beta-D-mannosaminyltransferase